MMYLSRLILNPRNRDVQRDLADCQALHRRILSGFAPTSDEGPKARERFGVLYRVEPGGGRPAVIVLVQSHVPANWSALPPRYLAPETSEQPNPAQKQIDGVLDQLRKDQVLAFRLQANPTRKIDTRSRSNGRRVELYREEDQQQWLRRKGEHAGFRVLAVRAAPAVLDVRIATSRKQYGWRADGTGDRRRLTFGAVLFEGRLQITDFLAFRQAVERGIGPGKAYGFGLLSVAPVT